ncbi:hypothetical protein [Agromyces bauzanensis]
MSEAKAPIDPRFDPRFQRGYVPDAAAPAAAEAPMVPTAPEVPASAPTPASVDDPVTATDGPEAEVPARPADPEPVRPAGDDASAPIGARSPSDPEPESALAALFEPSSQASSTFAAWFTAGWGVSVVAAVLGVSLWWASIASQNYYSGPGNESDRWLQAFGWMVAPSLVEAGLLGLVVMLVWTGLRHARRLEEPM